MNGYSPTRPVGKNPNPNAYCTPKSYNLGHRRAHPLNELDGASAQSLGLLGLTKPEHGRPRRYPVYTYMASSTTLGSHPGERVGGNTPTQKNFQPVLAQGTWAKMVRILPSRNETCTPKPAKADT